VICGIGLKPVRSLARLLLRRLWPPVADPYAALASFIAAASSADQGADRIPGETAVGRLAQLAVAGTGAQAAAVWCRGDDGTLRLAAHWPHGGDLGADGGGAETDGTGSPADVTGSRADVTGSRADGGSVADLADLAVWPGVDHLVPVLDADELLGALALTLTPTRGLTPRDERLAADMANAAGPLLRNVELTARLAEQVRRQGEQAAELERSRRRVLAARDAAREQLGREIGAKVGDPLLQCSATVSAMLDGGSGRDGGDEGSRAEELAEMSALIDAAIGDFRRIVHGVYPAVLTDHGLAPALENLLGDLPRRAVLSAPNLPRVAARVESGVYFCVTALVGSLPTGTDRPVRVNVESDHESLTVTILDGTEPAAGAESAQSAVPETAMLELPDVLRDRVEALEGTVRATGGREWSRYELKVPIMVSNEAIAA
jgi:signal transduction histidine kinase